MVPRLIPLAETCQRIHQSISKNGDVRNVTNIGVVLQRSKNPQPAVLQICHESRNESLKFFELIFGTYIHLDYIKFLDPGPKLLAKEPTVYFNARIDTLYLSSHFCDEYESFLGITGCPFWTLKYIKSLRSIAFDAVDFKFHPKFERTVLKIMWCDRKLREIIIVIRNGDSLDDSIKGELGYIMIEGRTQQQLAIDVVNQMELMFDRIAFKFARFTRRKYILRVNRNAFHGVEKEVFPTQSMMVSAKEENNPKYGAMKEYLEEIEFLRPEVKVMALVRGGVRI